VMFGRRTLVCCWQSNAPSFCSLSFVSVNRPHLKVTQIGFGSRHYATKQTTIDNWTSDELIEWLKRNSYPEVAEDLLEGFKLMTINGRVLRNLRPSTLYDAIQEAIGSQTQLSVPEIVFQETLLGSSLYSNQKRE